MDRYKIRGLVYVALSSLGLGYELFFVSQPRLFLVIMYGIVVMIGMALMFFVRENEENLPEW